MLKIVKNGNYKIKIEHYHRGILVTTYVISEVIGDDSVTLRVEDGTLIIQPAVANQVNIRTRWPEGM